MKKLMDIELVDIVPFSKGLLLARKDTLKSGATKVSFLSYDIKTELPAPITKGVYLLNKFGSAYKPIAEAIGDYVSCDAAILPNKHVAVVYMSGEVGLFDEAGALYWTGDLFYKEHPVCSCAAGDKYLWLAVPDGNCIVRYSPHAGKITLRIGGDGDTAFNHPISLSNYDDVLYVCNRNAKTIKAIDLKDLSVHDYKLFDEPVYKYIRACDKEIAALASGVYML